MKRSKLMLAGLVLLSLAALPSRGQEQRVVKWNNPDGPKIPGVEHRSFRSPSMEIEVGYNVYLPAAYVRGKGRFPVIYFLHGAGGTENSDAGAFSELMARLVEAKKIPPAICVYPNGGLSGYRDQPEQKVMGETLIIKELVPLIDRTYRTQVRREGRTITGFSMGGGGAVRLALKYPDLFSAAGSWAGALTPRRGGPAPELSVENLRKVNGQVRLLLIVGDKDLTFAGHAPVKKNLEEAAYPVKYEVLEGVSHDLGVYYEKTGDEMAQFLAQEFKPEN